MPARKGETLSRFVKLSRPGAYVGSNGKADVEYDCLYMQKALKSRHYINVMKPSEKKVTRPESEYRTTTILVNIEHQ